MIATDYLLCDLTDYGLLKIAGADACRLLQGQVTCDVESLKPGQSSFCAHCNPQGRVISLFYLFASESAYYLIMPRAMLSITLISLKKYAVFYKTITIDISEEFAVWGYEGRDKEGIAWEGGIVKLPSTTAHYLLLPKQGEKTALWEKQASLARLINPSEWKCLAIRQGIPSLYPHTSGQFLPYEMNLIQLGAINFEKGCYTGQEIIARMHYRGKPKTQLCQVRLKADTQPLPGEDGHYHTDKDEPISGTIVDVGDAGYNNYDVLIITRK
jgi:tRNA-modifying protein YgfZ